MPSLDRRLQRLESANASGECVACEVARLNADQGAAPPGEQCAHSRSFTWADVLACIAASPRSRVGVAGTPGACQS